jgi:hypothetical protein
MVEIFAPKTESRAKGQFHEIKDKQSCVQTVFKTAVDRRDISFAEIWYCPAIVVSDEPFDDISTL